MNKLLTLLILVLPLTLFGQQYQFGSGVVLGSKAAFQICAADGWVVDNKSGVSQGLHCVLYLKESNWVESPVIMYARVASPEYPELDEFIEFSYLQFKKQNPNFVREQLESMKVSEYEAKIYRYEDAIYRSFEATAYIQVPNAICYIVYPTGNKEDYNKYLNSFKEVISSFQYRPNFIDYSDESIHEETLNELCKK